MVGSGGVEPRPELHFFVADGIALGISLQSVRLAGFVAQKLEIDLVVIVANGRCLHSRSEEQDQIFSYY